MRPGVESSGLIKPRQNKESVIPARLSAPSSSGPEGVCDAGIASRVRRVCAAVAVGASLSVLSACATEEPAPPANPESDDIVTIMVGTPNTRQQIVAEIFEETLQQGGRDAQIVSMPMSDSDEAANDVRGNFFVGCTGETLEHFNPDAARELSKEYTAHKDDEGGEDYLARAHVELMASLPPYLTTVEPSGAEGCEGADPELPQNYVVVYKKSLLDRNERQQVTSLTKFLTQRDIDELEDTAKKTGSVPETVKDWMGANDSSSSIGGQSDSHSSGGSDLGSDS